METHDHTTTDRSDPHRVDLGVEEILHAIPTHGPSETRDVNHDDGGGASLLLRTAVCFPLDEGGDSGEECSDVHHRQGLEGYPDPEGAFAADHVDDEESADDGGDEFYDAENGGGEEFLVLSFGVEEGEEFGGVDCDRSALRRQ